jgi:DNA-binding response OmpR family regulator
MQDRVILLAESNELLQRILKSNLECNGFTILPALDGKTAAEILENEKIDLVVAEELLPYKNGLELISLAMQKNIQTIIISDARIESKIMEAFEVGAIDFIAKPFSPVELIARIKNALKSSTKLSTYPFQLK